MDNISRQVLVDCGLVHEFEKARYKSFKEYDREALDELEDRVGFDLVEECRSISNSRYQRVKRCRIRISGLVFTEKAFFLTLTFRDDVLAKTSAESRRRYVSRALKKVSANGRYIANVDFGKENGREHYHAIVEAVNVEALKEYWEKRYGFVDLRKIGGKEKDLKKTTKYINKLNAHCFKDSTHLHRVIYSRNKDIPPC